MTSSKREARVASVPPDAPVEIFVTEIGSTKGSCGWDSEGRRRPASERTGRFYVLDPVRDGARLRKSPPVFLEPPDAGHAKGSAEGQKGVHVRIESKRRAVTPTNLTPEQRERLRSLGYLQ